MPVPSLQMGYQKISVLWERVVTLCPTGNLEDQDFVWGFPLLGTRFSSSAEGCMARVTSDIAHSFLEACNVRCVAVHGFHKGSVYWWGNGTISGEMSLVCETEVADLVDIWVSSSPLHWSLCGFIVSKFCISSVSSNSRTTCLHKFHWKHF